MKKAKLMVSAMALLAVLATAFAFKAENFSNHVVFTGAITQQNNGTACQTRFEGKDITTTGTTQVRASTVSLSTGCPLAYTVAVDNIP